MTIQDQNVRVCGNELKVTLCLCMFLHKTRKIRFSLTFISDNNCLLREKMENSALCIAMNDSKSLLVFAVFHENLLTSTLSNIHKKKLKDFQFSVKNKVGIKRFT